MTTRERAIKIIKMLKHTIKKLGEHEAITSEKEIFRSPRAKKSDLISKMKEVKEKFKL